MCQVRLVDVSFCIKKTLSPTTGSGPYTSSLSVRGDDTYRTDESLFVLSDHHSRSRRSSLDPVSSLESRSVFTHFTRITFRSSLPSLIPF